MAHSETQNAQSQPAAVAAHRMLDSQVGGHPGVMTTEDGSLIIKPCLRRELEFYNKIAADDALASLRPFVPRMYGTLKQIANVELGTSPSDPEALLQTLQTNVEHTDTDSIVLENITHAFSKPATLDIKLGTVLYDDEASPEKKERMRKEAANTTSLQTGVRLVGFQVYDHSEGKNMSVVKDYGKSIKPTELPDGIRRFFPAAPLSRTEPIDQGLPPKILLAIISGLIRDITAIRDVLASLELRMVGGSILVSYECDWRAAELALADTALVTEQASFEDQLEDDDESVCSSDTSASEEGGGRKLFAVKLIDFAHTKLTPGHGSDAGVLLGLDTTLKLLHGRYQEVQKQG